MELKKLQGDSSTKQIVYCMDSDIPMYLQWSPYEPSIVHHYRESAMFYADLEPKGYNAQLPYISHVADNCNGCNMYIACDKT